MNNPKSVTHPEGATHYRQNADGTRRHFICYTDSHVVWLGKEHGGWSIMLPYPHPNMFTFVQIKRGLN